MNKSLGFLRDNNPAYQAITENWDFLDKSQTQQIDYNPKEVVLKIPEKLSSSKKESNFKNPSQGKLNSFSI